MVEGVPLVVVEDVVVLLQVTSVLNSLACLEYGLVAVVEPGTLHLPALAPPREAFGARERLGYAGTELYGLSRAGLGPHWASLSLILSLGRPLAAVGA